VKTTVRVIDSRVRKMLNTSDAPTVTP